MLLKKRAARGDVRGQGRSYSDATTWMRGRWVSSGELETARPEGISKLPSSQAALAARSSDSIARM